MTTAEKLSHLEHIIDEAGELTRQRKQCETTIKELKQPMKDIAGGLQIKKHTTGLGNKMIIKNAVAKWEMHEDKEFSKPLFARINNIEYTFVNLGDIKSAVNALVQDAHNDLTKQGYEPSRGVSITITPAPQTDGQ